MGQYYRKWSIFGGYNKTDRGNTWFSSVRTCHESIFCSSLSSTFCFLHCSVSNGKQSVDVDLGKVSRATHIGKGSQRDKTGQK